MVQATTLQSAYVDLYSKLRNYVWDFETIQAIADLEIATYQTFPDLEHIQGCLESLWSTISLGYSIDDEDLSDAYDSFKDVLSESDEIYAGIQVFKETEVVTHEDSEDEEVREAESEPEDHKQHEA